MQLESCMIMHARGKLPPETSAAGSELRAPTIMHVITLEITLLQPCACSMTGRYQYWASS